MQKITFYGWHVGMKKVAFSLLLRDEAGLGLKEAHESTIRVLDEEPVTLEVADELAARLLAKAEALGVKCRLEPAPEEPTREEADAFEGYEFDWFAQDATGAIALFSTAGWGEIPVGVIRHAAAHRAATASIAHPSIGTIDVWQDYAHVGLYVFDWQHWSGPYAKEVSPELVMAATLREHLLSIPELPQLPLSFSEVASVWIERFEPREVTE